MVCYRRNHEIVTNACIFRLEECHRSLQSPSCDCGAESSRGLVFGSCLCAAGERELEEGRIRSSWLVNLGWRLKGWTVKFDSGKACTGKGLLKGKAGREC